MLCAVAIGCNAMFADTVRCDANGEVLQHLLTCTAALVCCKYADMTIVDARRKPDTASTDSSHYHAFQTAHMQHYLDIADCDYALARHLPWQRHWELHCRFGSDSNSAGLDRSMQYKAA